MNKVQLVIAIFASLSLFGCSGNNSSVADEDAIKSDVSELKATPATTELTGVSLWVTEADEAASRVTGFNDLGDMVVEFILREVGDAHDYEVVTQEHGRQLRNVRGAILENTMSPFAAQAFNALQEDTSVFADAQDASKLNCAEEEHRTIASQQQALSTTDSLSPPPMCSACGADTKSKCYGVVLMCHDRKSCIDWERAESPFYYKNCGSWYPCGACFGFSW